MPRFLLVLVLVTGLVGCKKPEEAYFAEIARFHFIPFRMPVARIETGTLLRGGPDDLMPVAPAEHCFPHRQDGRAAPLRWHSEVTIPNVLKSMVLDFNAKLNSVVATGTPFINFNLALNKAKKVALEVKGAQIEMFDQLALRDYYKFGMSEKCRELVLRYPFVLEALQVTSMSFTFLDASGGKIAITSSNLGDFAAINVDVQWKIENGYQLVVTGPKYVGYRLVQLRAEDGGYATLVSTKTKSGAYVWKEITFQDY